MITNLAGDRRSCRRSTCAAAGGGREAKLPMMALSRGAVRRLAARSPGPIVVAGARELVPLLAAELRAGGDAAAVTRGPSSPVPPRSSGSGRRLDVLRAAARAGLPIVAVTDAESVPYVLDTDLVRVGPAGAFRSTRSRPRSPARSARAALRSPGACPSCAARSSRDLVGRAVRNGLIGAADVPARARDMPVLTLNQVPHVGSPRRGRPRCAAPALWPSSLRSRRRARRSARSPAASSSCPGRASRCAGASPTVRTWAVAAVLRRRLPDPSGRGPSSPNRGGSDGTDIGTAKRTSSC